MTLKNDFTVALERSYREAGEQTGYWGKRFIQKVRRVGGVETVKEMLTPRNRAQRAGLDAILEAGRPDLTVEHIVTRRRFRALFTAEELHEARGRLTEHQRASRERAKARANPFPDELDSRASYPAGARRTVRVNAFERNPAARRACIAFHGSKCAVCRFDFEAVYGSLGKGFIHVHHITPVSKLSDMYRLDPKKDLIPVCPNCHAMIHFQAATPRSVAKLKTLRRAR